jgi:hypothetical protein
VQFYVVDNVSFGEELDAKAPSNSPAFTGNPVAPTPAANDNSTSLATTAHVHSVADPILASLGGNLDYASTVTSLLAAKAPLASPVLTGAPQTSDPDAGSNDDRIANTQWVKARIAEAIAAMTGGAPGALDTLDELAAALNDDANFAATVTSLLAEKAPLASPVFTGAPIAPTQVDTDNSTKIATTAFVKGLLAGLQASIDLKAPLASPALTGTPVAPTAAADTNTTQIATTAYVQGELADRAPLASPVFTGSPTAPTIASVGSNSTGLVTTAYARNLMRVLNPLGAFLGATSAGGAPSTGTIRFGTSVPASVTTITMHYTDDVSFDMKARWLAAIKPDTIITINDVSAPADWAMYKVTTVTDNTTYMTLAVTFVGAGGAAQPSGSSYVNITVPTP